MYYSPLRYPGGKSKLCPFMEMMINKLDLKGGTYIEPFAGGAGIAIELLLRGIVSQIVINDYDKAIYSFWRAVTSENQRFIDKLYTTPVTIDEWYKQREILNSKKRYSFELGFATFFLNRTNRSGIINGGPIGGYSQDGEWKLDARFNKEKLGKQILRIGEKKDKIHVYNKDAKSFIVNYLPRWQDKAFVYFDPPYFEKGKKLYMNYFEKSDHIEIEKVIRDHVKCNWILTYDDVDEIVDIYDKFVIKRYNLNYSVAIKRTACELIIFPNENMCPTCDELNNFGVEINIQ